jgi:hypothetical protein
VLALPLSCDCSLPLLHPKPTSATTSQGKHVFIETLSSRNLHRYIDSELALNRYPSEPGRPTYTAAYEVRNLSAAGYDWPTRLSILLGRDDTWTQCLSLTVFGDALAKKRRFARE